MLGPSGIVRDTRVVVRAGVGVDETGLQRMRSVRRDPLRREGVPDQPSGYPVDFRKVSMA